MIKIKVKNIISLRSKIQSISIDINISDQEKESSIELIDKEIIILQSDIKKLNKEKKEAIGCDLNVNFNDDLFIKTDI
jgi:hypothetical protein